MKRCGLILACVGGVRKEGGIYYMCGSVMNRKRKYRTCDDVVVKEKEKSSARELFLPMVVMWDFLTCPSVNWEMRQVLPTPLSPHNRTLTRQS